MYVHSDYWIKDKLNDAKFQPLWNPNLKCHLNCKENFK